MFALSTTKNGVAILQASLPEKARLEVTWHGALPLLWRSRSRYGLLLGAIASALIFLSLSSFVWDVRVEGNSRLSDTKILAELKNAGLFVGASLRDLDQKQIAGDVLLASDDLSFVRVNMEGTVAHVTVRERDAAPETEKGGFANLVAREDAVVEMLSVSAGSTQVHVGQVVKRGDILVSGVTEGLHGNRLIRAEGEVLGRVKRSFSVSVPKEIAVSGEEYRKNLSVSLLFFGKSINIYRNTGNLPATYATIYHSDVFCLGNSLPLPFGVERVVLHTSEESVRTLSQQEQVRLAYARLQEQLLPRLQGAELLYKSVTGGFDGNGVYTLTCTLETLENIAISQEFSAN